MNNKKIAEFINEIFAGVPATEKVREQKEEINVNLTEKIKEYMFEAYTFDEAFDKAVKNLGDVNELLANFAQGSNGTQGADLNQSVSSRTVGNTEAVKEDYSFGEFPTGKYASNENKPNEDASPSYTKPAIDAAREDAARDAGAGIHRESDYKGKAKIVSLAPFIYILLGFGFGWWAWGWIIIPMSAIVFTGDNKFTIPHMRSRSRIKLVALAPFIYLILGALFGWWAWAWVIIPIFSILFAW